MASRCFSAMADMDSQQGAKRRRRFKSCDLAPVQLLNPMQESDAERCTSPQLWKALCAGNQGKEAFSELCFDESEHRIVGISRMAEVYLHAIERIESSRNTAVFLKEDIVCKIQAEIMQLKPHLRVLNIKAVLQREAQSLHHLAHLRARGGGVDAARLEEAARFVHAWLLKEDSILRDVMAYLAGAGVFWNAWVFDRSTRAFVEVKNISADTFVEIVSIRATVAGQGQPPMQAGLPAAM